MKLNIYNQVRGLVAGERWMGVGGRGGGGGGRGWPGRGGEGGRGAAGLNLSMNTFKLNTEISVISFLFKS